MGKLTNHPKMSSIQKFGKNKDTKQKKIQWGMLQQTNATMNSLYH
jgi:hypothetical protein